MTPKCEQCGRGDAGPVVIRDFATVLCEPCAHECAEVFDDTFKAHCEDLAIALRQLGRTIAKAMRP